MATTRFPGMCVGHLPHCECTRRKQALPSTVRGMTTKNLTKTAAPDASAEPAKPARPSGADALVETITLSNHLRINGTDHLPGAQIRVPADYARRLRLSGYVART